MSLCCNYADAGGPTCLHVTLLIPWKSYSLRSAGLGCSVFLGTTADSSIQILLSQLMFRNKTQDITGFKVQLLTSSQTAHSGLNPEPIYSYILCCSMNITPSYTTQESINTFPRKDLPKGSH